MENSPFMDKNTFDEFDLMRGKRVAGGGLFAKKLGEQGQSRVINNIIYYERTI